MIELEFIFCLRILKEKFTMSSFNLNELELNKFNTLILLILCLGFDLELFLMHLISVFDTFSF